MLPQELKTHIYELVLGGHFIHISKRTSLHDGSRKKFSHFICYTSLSEADAQELFDSSDGLNTRIKELEGRHQRCHATSGSGNPLRLDFSLLHCCRQIRDEAWSVPYSKNTFSFHNARQLYDFVQQLSFHSSSRTDFNLAIRSLHVEMTGEDCYLHQKSGWCAAFDAVAERMQCIQQIGISLDEHFSWGAPWWAACQPLLAGIAVLSRLPLKVATLVISSKKTLGTTYLYNGMLWTGGRTGFRFDKIPTLAEKQEWVARAKETLLRQSDCDQGAAL